MIQNEVFQGKGNRKVFVDKETRSVIATTMTLIRHILLLGFCLLPVYNIREIGLGPDYFDDDPTQFFRGFIPCEPWNSCVGRCGLSFVSMPPYTCYCDLFCSTYGDCCADYRLECGDAVEGESDIAQFLFAPLDWNGSEKSRANSSEHHSIWALRSNADHGQLECVDVGQREIRYIMITRCDSSWTNNETRQLCEDLCLKLSDQEVPVSDQMGVVYRNIFCAQCNFQNGTLHPWIVEVSCDEEEDDEDDPLFVTSKDDTMQDDQRICNSSQSKGDRISEKCHVQYIYNASGDEDLSPRICFHTIGSCPHEPHRPRCESYSGAVITRNTKQIFRNPHCAVCNGIDPKMILCPRWIWRMRNSEKQEDQADEFALVPKVQANKNLMLSYEKNRNMPASVTILLNFGPDGQQRMMFSSEKQDWMFIENKQCEADHLWDPFLKVCRRLHCSAQFNLINFRCVHKYKQGEEQSVELENSHDLSNRILGLDTDTVSISLRLQAIGDAIDEALLMLAVEESLFATLASVFVMNNSRFLDLNFLTNITNETLGNEQDGNITQHTATTLAASQDNSRAERSYTKDEKESILHVVEVKFLLTEADNPSEPSVDKFVAMMMAFIAQDNFALKLQGKDQGFTVKVSDLQEESFVKDQEKIRLWCQDGDRAEYINEDFDIVYNNDSSKDFHVRINKTGLSYSKGQFIANFVFHGNQAIGGLTNVSGIVIVCENKSTIRDRSCVRLRLERHEYTYWGNKTYMYNGTLSVASHLHYGEYERGSNDSLWVCLQFPSVRVIGANLAQAYTTLIGTSISLAAIALTLFSYFLFSELRNLPGVNLMNMTAMLFLSQITFLLGTRSSVKGIMCYLVAISEHYEILATFFWMNVMAYDLYKTFGTRFVLPYIRSKEKYAKRYAAYAYLTPLVIVATAVSIDELLADSPLSPKYGTVGCWIASPVASGVFFAIPLTVLMLINIVLYGLTVRSIFKVTRLARLSSTQRGGNDVKLYVRMSTILGFTWVFGIARAFAPINAHLLCLILDYLFICFFSLQGLFVFGAFICNRRVLLLYKDQFAHWCRRIHEPLKRLQAPSQKCVCNLKISRSSSTVTCGTQESDIQSENSSISMQYY